MRLRQAAWLLSIGLASGCSPAAPRLLPAGGTVRLDGKPLRGAAIRFVPLSENRPEYTAGGVTDGAGRYVLRCAAGGGALAGLVRVVVLEADIPERLQAESAQADLRKHLDGLGGRPLPLRYASLTETPLEVTVEPGRPEYDFDLTHAMP